MDETTLQVYSVLFLLATVVLVVTARFFQARRGPRRMQRKIAAFERIPGWTLLGAETNRPLHLAFGDAGVGGEVTPVALAEAELFHHVIEGAKPSDVPPIVSLSSPTTLPLAQDTMRRAWGDGSAVSRALWLPPDLAYAGAITALMAEEQPTAHIMAGGFGAELALMLDNAERRGQETLAVSDRLDGQAVAYAMADHSLIGEELFAASGYVDEADSGHGDAAVIDVWRALMILGVTLALLLEFSQQLPLLNWQVALVGVAILVLLSLFFSRRR